MDIRKIRELVRKDKYEYSIHAVDMLDERGIRDRDVKNAILNGEILETYTEDVRGKGYLILGEGPLHVLERG